MVGNTCRRCAFAALWAIATGLSLGACQHSLFMDSNTRTDSVINRYYNGDSAVKTSESRKQAADMGFGYPTGPAFQ